MRNFIKQETDIIVSLWILRSFKNTFFFCKAHLVAASACKKIRKIHPFFKLLVILQNGHYHRVRNAQLLKNFLILGVFFIKKFLKFASTVNFNAQLCLKRR